MRLTGMRTRPRASPIATTSRRPPPRSPSTARGGQRWTATWPPPEQLYRQAAAELERLGLRPDERPASASWAASPCWPCRTGWRRWPANWSPSAACGPCSRNRMRSRLPPPAAPPRPARRPPGHARSAGTSSGCSWPASAACSPSPSMTANAPNPLTRICCPYAARPVESRLIATLWPAAQILGDLARHFRFPGAEAHYRHALAIAEQAHVEPWREAAMRCLTEAARRTPRPERRPP